MDARVLVINGVTIDVSTERLSDAGGRSIELRPQAFAVLRHLLQNANRLVTKDELMQAVWPGLAVTDDSLVQCVHEIRRALNDDTHATLKTAPRRGYRMTLATNTAAPAIVDPRPRPPWAAVAAAALLVLFLGTAAWWWAARSPVTDVGRSPSLAVLPFDNLGGDPAQRYFADGITEDLITDLSKISGILVIARNSVWEYRDATPDLRQIASDLGVRYVLEGSVRRNGDQMRINAQLVDVSGGGHHLWADRYDTTVSEVFAVQDEVIGHIVSALAVELTADEAAAAGEVETTSALAYDAVLRGIDYLHRDTEAETLRAIELFESAIAHDPDYSRAYAALAAANWRIVLSYWFVTTGAGFDHAYRDYRRYIAKALERPTSLAYATLANNYSYEGRYQEALDAIDKAMALAPSDPDNHVVRAMVLNAMGHAGEAEDEVRLATRLDPRYPPLTLRVLSMSLLSQGRNEEAADTVRRIEAQQAMDLQDWMTLAAAYGHLGRLDEIPGVIADYNAKALPAFFDPFTVEESQQFWMGDSFNVHTPYMDNLVEGLRKAGVPEGAGMDIQQAEYKPLMTRTNGEYDVRGATKVDAAQARALHDRGVVFVDVRPHLDFAAGHAPGAVNLSLSIDLDKDALAAVAAPDEEVVFSCHGKYCPVSAYASAKAVKWGWTRAYYFAGGFPAWQDAGYAVETGASVVSQR